MSLIVTMEIDGQQKPTRTQYVWTCDERWPIPESEMPLVKWLYASDEEFMFLHVARFIQGDYERLEWETRDEPKAREIAAFCRERCRVVT